MASLRAGARNHHYWRLRLLAWSDEWDKRIGNPTPSLLEIYKADRATKGTPRERVSR